MLQNQPLVEAPRAAAPLILEVYPTRSGARMPKGFPEHWQIVAIRANPYDVLHTDPLGIAALQPICDAKRVAFALAPPAQEALIPPAWCQLIPDERGNAA